MMPAADYRKRYIVYIRAVLSIAMALVAFYNFDSFVSSISVSLTYLLLVIASNFVFAMLPASYYKGIKMHYIVFVTDILIIVVGAYIFTQLNIEFLLAIFLTIFMSAISQSVGLAVVVAVVVNAVYIYMKYLVTAQYQIFEDTAFLNIPFIFIVALHASYMAEKANQDSREKLELEKIGRFLAKKVHVANTELAQIADFMDQVMESFKYGLIIIDVDGAVRLFNRKSEKIFGVKSSRAEGLPLKDLEFLGEVKEAVMDLSFKGQESFERVVVLTEPKKNLYVTVSSIQDKNGEGMGILCVIKEENNGK